MDELAELRKQRDASMKVEFQLREQTTDMEQRLHVFEERVDQLTNEKKFFQERNGKYFDEKYEAQERVRELIKASPKSLKLHIYFTYEHCRSSSTLTLADCTSSTVYDERQAVRAVNFAH